MDRKVFFANVRAIPFGGVLSQRNVDGITALLDEYNKRYPHAPISHIAYLLATTFHETAGTMAWDIVEIGKGRGKPYGKPAKNGKTYYGRGYSQLTWETNYRKLSDVVHADLVSNPDDALKKENSAAIIIEGMERGLFTGKKLDDYFSNGREDVMNARRIVNGTDKAALIARYFTSFSKALIAAKSNSTVVAQNEGAEAEVPLHESETVDSGGSLLGSKTVVGGAVAAATGIMPALLGGINNPYALAAFAIVAVAGLVFCIYGRNTIKYKFGV